MRGLQAVDHVGEFVGEAEPVPNRPPLPQVRNCAGIGPAIGRARLIKL
jgi:hypothetical protein